MSVNISYTCDACGEAIPDNERVEFGVVLPYGLKHIAGFTDYGKTHLHVRCAKPLLRVVREKLESWERVPA